MEVEAGGDDWLDDCGDEPGHCGLTQFQNLIGEGGVVRALEGWKEELLKMAGHGSLDLLADWGRSVEVDEDRSVARGSMALMVLAPDWVLGLFEGWGPEGNPQS